MESFRSPHSSERAASEMPPQPETEHGELKLKGVTLEEYHEKDMGTNYFFTAVIKSDAKPDEEPLLVRTFDNMSDDQVNDLCFSQTRVDVTLYKVPNKDFYIGTIDAVHTSDTPA